MSFLQVSQLSVSVQGTEVLKDINFGYDSFQRLAVAGETGSGKTTLLKTIAGLLQASAGEVLFGGERVPGPLEKLLPGHSRIAYLSQHFELRNNYRVADYLEMASKIDPAMAHRIYDLCHISHLLQRKTDQLSGGERQRTALARLLTTSPQLLVLDEPYSNLDGIHKQLLKQVIENIVADGTACLLVSHDPADVLPWAEEVLVLKEGRICQRDIPQKIYGQPVDEYTGGLFGDYNLLSAAEAKTVFGANGLAPHQKLFVRPENIQLLRGEYGGQQKGLVTGLSFYGSYVEAEVLFQPIVLKVKMLQASFQKGDVVSATAVPKAVWIL